MQTLVIEDPPARLVQPMTEDAFFEFCQRNRHIRIERLAGGDVLILPPVGFAGSDHNAEVVVQLRVWASKDGRGRAVGPDAGYTLPSGAVLSPDASSVSKERLAGISKEEYQKFRTFVRNS